MTTWAELREQCGFCLRAWNRFWPVKWAWLIGGSIGFTLALFTPQRWLNTTFPPVKMTAAILEKYPHELHIALSGVKPWYAEYQNCIYRGIDAYDEVDGRLRDLHMERTDKKETGFTRPPGAHSFGTWRIWPTTTTRRVVVYVNYSCQGDPLQVRAVEIVL